MKKRIVSLAVLLLVLAFGALLFSGCQSCPAAGPLSLRYAGPFTCTADFRDAPCIACLKAHCCMPATACNDRKDKCACAIGCLSGENTMKCAAACSEPEDKVMATCSASACAALCPGGTST